MIAPRAPGSSTWDWITLGALFAATCVLLIGTLYVNKQGTLRLSGKETSDLARQLGIAQSVALVITSRRSFQGTLANQLSFYSFFRPAIWNFSA